MTPMAPPPPATPLPALEAVLYGLLQGITEFLPVSSSTHLDLLGRGLSAAGRQPLDGAYEMLFHLPTLAAVLWVLRGEIRATLWGPRRDRIPALLLACLATAAVGMPLEHLLPREHAPLWGLGAALIGTGIVLLATERLKPAPAPDGTPWTWDRGIAVGLGQSLAGVPGLSRLALGSCTGLLTGRSHVHALVFSLLCSFPVALGKAALECRESLQAGEPDFWTNRVLHGAYPLGALAAFLAGIAAFRWLLKRLERGTFAPFGIYCVVLGALALTGSSMAAKIPPLPTDEPKAGIPGLGPDGGAPAPAPEPPVLRPEGPPGLPAP